MNGKIRTSVRKILIGSNGGLTGIYLAKRFRMLPDVIVCGSDSTENHAGRFFVAEQFQVPRSDSADFIPALTDLMNRNKIDVYFPTHSTEVRAVSLYEKEIRNTVRTKFLVCPIETFLALEDKVSANQNLKYLGVPVPELIDGFSHEYPIFMKRRTGSGSMGSAVIENSQIHRAYMETMQNMAFFQLLRGGEYTVDCLYDSQGKLLGYRQRERVKTIGGAVSITRNAPQFDISPWLNMISCAWIFRGCVNFQYILSDGIPYFIDVNLRFPSGGLPLTVHSGLNIPELLLELMLNGSLQTPANANNNNRLTMYRYFEEIFDDGISGF